MPLWSGELPEVDELMHSLLSQRAACPKEKATQHTIGKLVLFSVVRLWQNGFWSGGFLSLQVEEACKAAGQQSSVLRVSRVTDVQHFFSFFSSFSFFFVSLWVGLFCFVC